MSNSVPIAWLTYTVMPTSLSVRLLLIKLTPAISYAYIYIYRGYNRRINAALRYQNSATEKESFASTLDENQMINEEYDVAAFRFYTILHAARRPGENCWSLKCEIQYQYHYTKHRYYVERRIHPNKLCGGLYIYYIKCIPCYTFKVLSCLQRAHIRTGPIAAHRTHTYSYTWTQSISTQSNFFFLSIHSIVHMMKVLQIHTYMCAWRMCVRVCDGGLPQQAERLVQLLRCFKSTRWQIPFAHTHTNILYGYASSFADYNGNDYNTDFSPSSGNYALEKHSLLNLNLCEPNAVSHSLQNATCLLRDSDKYTNDWVY